MSDTKSDSEVQKQTVELRLPTELTEALLGVIKTRRKLELATLVKWGGVTLFIGVWLVISYLNSPSVKSKPDEGYVAAVRIDGGISARSTSNYRQMAKALRDAFGDDEAKGVMLIINSPGGSAAQSLLLYEEVRRLKVMHDKRVVAVGEDFMTSGAYMVAMAADEVYANPMALVGSIGVRMDSFSFEGLMEKLGVERRSFTAGEHKARMDPYLPMSAADEEKMREVVGRMHKKFIEIVQRGRDGKLAGEEGAMFSGDYWTGSEAVTLGLTDGELTPMEAAKSLYGVDALRYYEPEVRFSDVLGSIGM